MTRREVFGWLAGGLAAGLSGCGIRRASLRYRLAIDVDTPNGLRSGSGVVETVMSAAPQWLGIEAGGSNSTFGQAPFVTLDDGRRLFVLLHGVDWQQLMGSALLSLLAYGELQPPLSRRFGFADWKESFADARRILPSGTLDQNLPMLVTFADPAAPTSVVEVDPKNAAAVLGSGYDLRALALQVVPDSVPLTTGIEKLLPWLGPVIEAHLGEASGRINDIPLYAKLNNASFRMTGR